MFGTADRCDSELHSTAYRAEGTGGTGVNGSTECVRWEYCYAKSRLLKHTANKECLPFLFIVALCYF